MKKPCTAKHKNLYIRIENKNMAKVFLGGVREASAWRLKVIPKLKIEYTDPKVGTDTQEDCDFLLYVITPNMIGFELIPNLIDASNKKPEKTLYCAIFEEGSKAFSAHQRKSLEAVGKMVERNGGRWLKSLDEVVDFLNSYE